ncbi:MAG: Gfo/Idh/MocA family oxidoreductase [Clostridia bacterium]|nr:Gfo/Idh/MocA family oxidoreductase [Clostridia bacterium]
MDKLKIGIFGTRRGADFAHAAELTGKAYVSAVCDFEEKHFDNIRKFCSEETQYFSDFDEFIDSGMDAVVLTNYFNQHAKYAVKALEKGIHVLSETLPAVTMAECVDICRAAEKSKAIYMLAENYAYFSTVEKMTELYKGKTLGGAIYAEGEYVHPMSYEEYVHYTPTSDHWRALMPSGYYMTHSLAPLMKIIDDVPVAVNAVSIYSDDLRQERDGEPVKDVASIMLCSMKGGSVARVTGWAKFGGHGNWYRIACAKGSMETVRGDQDSLRLLYNKWEMPEGAEQESVEKIEFTHDREKGEQCGHAGGDYYVTLDFIDCILEGREPYFNAYRSCAMSAVGILGWRSSLHNGEQYKIPDFSNEEERKAYENDNLSPFPDENGNINYPCTKYEADKFDI